MGKNKFLEAEYNRYVEVKSRLNHHTSTPVQRFFGCHKLVPANGPKQNS
jgi:hypothetical protein